MQGGCCLTKTASKNSTALVVAARGGDFRYERSSLVPGSSVAVQREGSSRPIIANSDIRKTRRQGTPEMVGCEAMKTQEKCKRLPSGHPGRGLEHIKLYWSRNAEIVRKRGGCEKQETMASVDFSAPVRPDHGAMASYTGYEHAGVEAGGVIGRVDLVYATFT
ncbi:hypothetical protein ANO11243_023630 [Dothideomycetidae sp. 11243]|nr:hypothetical protein ANO11243_023630 [fungal sp. No.11243]